MSDNENGNNTDSFEETLMLKRDSILDQMRSIDSSITEVQEELARKIEQLHTNKGAYEGALNHVQALLDIEANGLPPIVNPLGREGGTFKFLHTALQK